MISESVWLVVKYCSIHYLCHTPLEYNRFGKDKQRNIASMVLCIFITICSLQVITAQDLGDDLDVHNNESEKTKQRNAVMGGILGGIFGALVVGGLLFYVWRNFGSRHNQVQVLDSSSGWLRKNFLGSLFAKFEVD